MRPEPHDKVGFTSQRCKATLTPKIHPCESPNVRTKTESHGIISTDSEEVSDKTQPPFLIIILSETGTEGKCPQPDKGHL